MASETLTLRVDAKSRKRLARLAESTGRSRSFLPAEAIAEYLDANEWQIKGIKAALASVEQEGTVAHEGVDVHGSILGMLMRN
jgi:RHH-type transcriptional regulator, rel operon repressor / antitoxin RelB